METDPLWYKDAIIYEVHVRAFFDSNGDGRGDFPGLTAKLDYIQDLGMTAIWLLPFYPSPWRDDGYDISNYTDIHPAYGAMRDFQLFLDEAHRRGLRVITELVLNHTSDQHPWFQRSRRAKPGTRWRDFYVWSNTPDKYPEARIIFKDFETSNWSRDPIADAYYWHRFYSHQPDLNYDNPLVRRAMFRIVDFWLDRGVDGFRLDAITYLFEREGTNCENLPETHAYLKELRRHIDSRYQDRMLLAEANLWPEDAVAYFGSGDECHISFHFPLMPRLFTAIRGEDRFPIVEIMRQTPPIPDNCQWALFLRNHDELTLEMVTDEERDYMYRVYAQDAEMRINLGIRRRLAPLLGNDRRRIELMNALLYSLPGSPVTYYGDEIGMGDNVYLGDRNGVRTPMQWSADRNAGFSNANPQRLYLPINIDPEYHYEAVNVENQQNNTHSLLWWMKRIIALRKQYKAIGRGTLEFLQPDNRKVLAFTRRYKDECVLVVANLSRFAQAAALDLSAFKGMSLVEMFGGNEFPPVRDQPYELSLGPHAFYWLAVESRRPSIEAVSGTSMTASPLPLVQVKSLENPFDEGARIALAQHLPGWLKTRRWFQGTGRRIDSLRFLDLVPILPSSAWIALIQVEYTEGDPQMYTLLASMATGQEAERMQAEHPDVAAFLVQSQKGERGLLYSALWDKKFGPALLEAFVRRRRFRGERGELVANRTGAFREIWQPAEQLEPAAVWAEQANNSIAFRDRFILKLFRRLEQGVNPDVEIGMFLAEKASIVHVPVVAGSLEYRTGAGEPPITLGVLHSFIRHEANAWHYTMDSLGRFFERVRMRPQPEQSVLEPEGASHHVMLSSKEVPGMATELIGTYLERARLLGQRTAELHTALAEDRTNPDFAPEPFSDSHRLAMYHSMLTLVTRSLEILHRLSSLPEPALREAQAVLGAEEKLRKCLRFLRDTRIKGMRIRTHGHYHLGQVLFTGKDFVIIDFEGEPHKHFSERRKKRSPLQDVASMLVSFRYAASAAQFGVVPGVIARPEEVDFLERWGEFWYRWVRASFVSGYLGAAKPATLIPSDEEAGALLEICLLEESLSRLEQSAGAAPERILAPLQVIASVVRNWNSS